MAEEVTKRPRGRPRKEDQADQPKKRGRPTKAEAKRREEAAEKKRKELLRENAKEAYKSVTELMEDFDLSELPPIFKCSKCGKVTSSPTGRFYMVPTLAALDGNDHYCNICIECTKKYFEDFTARYRDEKIGLLLTCSFTGHYFSEELYEQMVMHGDSFNLGYYFRTLNTLQFKGKNFMTYLLEIKDANKLFLTQDEVREYQESKWKTSDKRNQLSCIKTLGYDCFDDPGYSNEDRRYLYNTLSGYLTDEVISDPHKINCVIGMTKNLWQRDRLNSIVNQMLKNSLVDSQEIQRLNSAKSALETSINATAKANGISMEGSGKKSPSLNTLTGIMKQMAADGFSEVKVNFVDALMADGYRKAAEQSARALVAEMNYTSDEYAKMVAEQNGMVRDLRQKLTEQEEENRKLRVQIDQMKKRGKAAKAKPVEEIQTEEDVMEFLEGSGDVE